MARAKSAQKYEYVVVSFKCSTEAELAGLLNEWAAKGWRLHTLLKTAEEIKFLASGETFFAVTFERETASG
jgi:hypothetical protein